MHKYAAGHHSYKPVLPFSPGSGRRVEIGRLFTNPGKKARDFGMIGQFGAIAAAARKFGIGEHAFDRAAADRMHRHGRPPAPAFGHRVIAIDLRTQRAPAQPARLWRQHRVILHVEVVFVTVMSGH